MDKYIQSLSMVLHREFADEKHVAIICNESADLDSICSATVLAFHLTQYMKISHIPIIACNREDLILRTEALYAFKQMGLNLAKLLYANDVISQENKITTVILVDNNFINTPQLSTLELRIRGIIDHRPWEVPKSYYSDAFVSSTMETVGSCATLIAEKVFKENPHFEDNKALSLLRGCILLDTANMSIHSKKVTPKDEIILGEIEARLGKNIQPRLKVFSELEAAKEDTSSFDCGMLIKKDMKTIHYPGTALFPIAVSVIPEQNCLCVLTRDDFDTHISQLTDPFNKGFSIVILLGSGDTYDMLLIGPTFNGFKTKIVDALLNLEDAKMKLIDRKTMCKDNPALDSHLIDRYQVAYLTFQNKEYSRKKLMPIIKSAVAAELADRTQDGSKE